MPQGEDREERTRFMATMHFDPSGLQQQLEQARQKREMESLPELAGVPVRACVLFANQKAIMAAA